jgi:hypothetical protein
VDKFDIEAVNAHGRLKLPRALPLQEGSKVVITFHTVASPGQRLFGLMPWSGDREEFDHWLNDPDEGQWGNRDI